MNLIHFSKEKIKFTCDVKATPSGIQIVTNVPNCHTNQHPHHTEEHGGRAEVSNISNVVKQCFHSNSKSKGQKELYTNILLQLVNLFFTGLQIRHSKTILWVS